jgi:hypothetical protein
VSGETEARTGVQTASAEPAYRSKGKSLVVLQVKCRSIYNKAIEFWNLVDTYKPDVIIGTESWLTLQSSEDTDLPVVVGCLISLPVRGCG